MIGWAKWDSRQMGSLALNEIYKPWRNSEVWITPYTVWYFKRNNSLYRILIEPDWRFHWFHEFEPNVFESNVEWRNISNSKSISNGFVLNHCKRKTEEYDMREEIVFNGSKVEFQFRINDTLNTGFRPSKVR